MPVSTDEALVPTLTVSREVGPRADVDGKSVGAVALRDALIIVLVAWAILFALFWSLRSHNI
jgi:hypothetical protein